MKTTVLIYASVFVFVFFEVFSQNETSILGFNAFNSNSFAFIEFIKYHQESTDLAKWYEGKVDSRLTSTLIELNEFSKKYPQELEITVIPFGSTPKENNPLYIIYRLVDIKEKKELSVLFSYTNNNLLIDHLTAVNLTELLKDCIRNPLPEPPIGDRNK